MQDEDIKLGILELVRLTEEYLALPDSSVFGLHLLPAGEADRIRESNIRERNKIKRAVEKTTNARKDFLYRALDSGLYENKELVVKASMNLLSDDKLTERQKLIAEYEFSFLGVNPITRQKFNPTILQYLREPDKALIDIPKFPSGVRTENLLDAMVDYEMARYNYSNDGEYASETDLSGKVFRVETVYRKLKGNIARFLRGKRRILEIGFLHQRIYDLIMEIDPSVEYHGVDISIPAVQIARRKGITAFNANARYAIPYNDRYFDGVISSTVVASMGTPYQNDEVKRVMNDSRSILNFDLQ